VTAMGLVCAKVGRGDTPRANSCDGALRQHQVWSAPVSGWSLYGRNAGPARASTNALNALKVPLSRGGPGRTTPKWGCVALLVSGFSDVFSAGPGRASTKAGFPKSPSLGVSAVVWRAPTTVWVMDCRNFGAGAGWASRQQPQTLEQEGCWDGKWPGTTSSTY
jgi:hypothetical protein